MRIGIIGAGAMGSLFGAMLARAGEDVVWLEKRPEYVEALNSRGITLRFGEESFHVDAPAVSNPAALGDVDVVMLWTKAFDSAQAMADVAGVIGPRTAVCTLQNGLGNIEAIEAHVAPENVVYGATGIGAVQLAPGEVHVTEGAWTGAGVSWIGTRTDAARAAVDAVGVLLNKAGLTTHVRDDIDEMVWNKLAMATAMSSISTVTRLKMGHILDTPVLVDLLRTLTEEIVAVANAKSIPLDADDAVSRNLRVYEAGREHLASMLQDALAERRTEVGALTRGVVREGLALGVPTPANATLAAIIETIEGNYDLQLLPNRVAG